MYTLCMARSGRRRPQCFIVYLFIHFFLFHIAIYAKLCISIKGNVTVVISALRIEGVLGFRIPIERIAEN